MKLTGMGHGLAEATPWIGALLVWGVFSTFAGNHPLDHWQSRNTGASNFITGGGIVTSTDGINWTKRAAGEFAGASFSEVGFGNYSFVVAGVTASGGNLVVQSATIINLQLAMDPEPSLILRGPTHSRVRVEATSDPNDSTSWAAVETVTMETDPFHWVDPQPSNASSRFYRAVLTE
jgi:hypothetical protein